MITSLALVLLVTASGTLAAYLYDEDATFAARLCAGACVGITVLGLVGFIFASFLGLTSIAILLTAVVLSLPFLLLRNQELRVIVREDLQGIARAIRNPTRLEFGYFVFYSIVIGILGRVFERAMLDLPEGMYTGVVNNFGDLPFHISVISGFAFGNNFPPEDPTYAGVKFTYPFLTDFVSAIFVRCGASYRLSMFIENFVVALAFVGLLHRWALAMLRDRLAAVITPVLVFLSGGLGWIRLWEATKKNEGGLIGVLQNLPSSFTIIPDTTWRWGNAVSTLLVPQRGFLLGLPLAVIVFTQWWLAEERKGEQGNRETGEGENGERVKGKGKRKKQRAGTAAQSNPPTLPLSPFPFSPFSVSVRRMIAAGIVAGLIPLVHAHSFVAVMAVGACIALLQRRWRDWFTFFLVASLVALPQMWWSTHNSAVNAGKFFAWQFGWDHGQENVVWFWLKNTGLFIPVAVAAMLWRSDKGPLVSRRLLIFLLPFAICFIVPNLLKMAPWLWDNIKVLFYWWVAFAPLVALLLARLWRGGGSQRIAAAALFACLTLAGALDVAAIAFRSNKYEVFLASGINFAEVMKRETPPNAVVIHAPVHNHPVFLTGRRSLLGYPGHVWTHGLEFGQRESEIKRVYSGAFDAPAILKKYGVSYVVVGPIERSMMNVNEQFFSKFQTVGEVGGYRLYKITQP